MSFSGFTRRVDGALGLRRVSAGGFRHAAGNLIRIVILLGTLWTLALVRGDAPLSLVVPAVAISLGALYAIDRKSGRLGLWAAYMGGFVLFALLRTTADETGIPVRADYAVNADKALFGGVLPQQWLQQRFYDSGKVGPLDVFVVAIVFSYFIVPHLVALIAWRRDYALFTRYCPAVLVTVYTGLLVSYLAPTAPPWLANRFTDSPPVSRVVADVLGWNPENVHPESGGSGLNPVAAMPSLHLAVTTLIVIALWRRRYVRFAAVAYAAAMAFALVYGGEHYVVDLLAGIATAALAWLAVTRMPLRRARRAPSAARAPAAVAPASTTD
jgi:membrane-associated phospholipid phosphatase